MTTLQFSSRPVPITTKLQCTTPLQSLRTQSLPTILWTTHPKRPRDHVALRELSRYSTVHIALPMASRQSSAAFSMLDPRIMKNTTQVPQRLRGCARDTDLYDGVGNFGNNHHPVIAASIIMKNLQPTKECAQSFEELKAMNFSKYSMPPQKYQLV